MADKRKLQAEIDRCLKKITEGVETFQDTWQKVHHAANANQKEKYEADLKKEIKKLQRLRDQIKTWITSNDIKDKQVLVDKRKLIETQMEVFKVVERETKTKAYSKEGLGLATKIDPETREKEEFRHWLTDAIDQLNVQMDHFESELESLNSGPKKRKPDKDKNERVEELNGFIVRHKYHVKQLELILRMLDNSTISPADMQNLKEDMQYYIDFSTDADFEENEYIYNDLMLDEVDIESMNNLATSPTDCDEEFLFHKENSVPVNLVQPNSPTTLTNNYSNKSPVVSPRNSKCSPGPVSVNNIGNELSPVAKVPSPKVNSSNGGNNNRVPTTPPAKTVNTSIVNSDFSVPFAEPKSPGTPPPVSGYAGVVGGNNHNQVPTTPTSQPDVIEKAVTPTKKQPPVLTLPHNSTDHVDTGNNSPSVNDLITSLSSLSVAPSLSSVTTMGTSVTTMGTSLATIGTSLATIGTSLAQTTTPPSSSTKPLLDPLTTSISSAVADLAAVSSPTLHTTTSSIISNAFAVAGLSLSSTSTASPSVAPSTLFGTPNVSDTLVESPPSHGPLIMSTQTHNEQEAPNSLTTLKTMAAQAVATAVVENNREAPKQFNSDIQNRVLFESAISNGGETRCEAETRSAHLQPLLGVAPLGPVPLNKEKLYQLALVEPAFHHLPFASDSERVRPYLPRNAYPTAGYHHHQIPPHLDSIEFFQRLSTETLFFIFYYQEGTRAQYLAAKALKKQSWRFHMKYMMWFQRHEEPKAITDEYEQGTYIYFDYEKWTQRKKDGFTFEYKYLEDKDLP